MKFKPAKLKLENGDTIRIVAVTDSNGEVDIKVVDKEGNNVPLGILAVITPEGLWRLGNISSDIGLPLDDAYQRLIICKE